MISVRPYNTVDQEAWDQYVENHSRGTLYHLSGWKNVIEKTYGHKTYYLMAISEPHGSQLNIVGILPLVHLKHFLFNNSLIAIPFFDLGGILAEDEETEKVLLTQAIKLGHELKVENIELRHIAALSWLTDSSQPSAVSHATKSHKVRMLLDLPDSSEVLMKSFKAKLRSQIKKPIKEGLKARVGGIELLNEFYKVFLINMRDLGSPVHSKEMMQNVLLEFPNKSRIIIIYKGKDPVACGLIVGFKDTLGNPWASALRTYSRLSPNMLLYWTMLAYGCNNGFKYFDFGRSSPDEGTYKFKKQWGAKPTPLHWQYIGIEGKAVEQQTQGKSKFEKAIHYWQKLPVPVTKVLGPPIRKHIGL